MQQMRAFILLFVAMAASCCQAFVPRPSLSLQADRRRAVVASRHDTLKMELDPAVVGVVVAGVVGTGVGVGAMIWTEQQTVRREKRRAAARARESRVAPSPAAAPPAAEFGSRDEADAPVKSDARADEENADDGW